MAAVATFSSSSDVENGCALVRSGNGWENNSSDSSEGDMMVVVVSLRVHTAESEEGADREDEEGAEAEG